MKIQIITTLIFLTFNTVYGQIDKPKYILASKLYSSNQTLALVVRFNKGIDSINFPIDTTLIKPFIKKLDINGKDISPKKVYYEYRFTAIRDTIYKLPSAQVWSNSKPFDISINEYVRLKKPKEIVTISKSDSLKLELEKQKEKRKKLKLAQKQRLENKIDSRISRNIAQKTALLWIDKNILKVNEDFRIIIESNVDFDQENITIDYLNKLNDNIEVLKKIVASYYDNGNERYYIIFICKALAKGEFKVEPITIKTEKTTIKTNKWYTKIIN